MKPVSIVETLRRLGKEPRLVCPRRPDAVGDPLPDAHRTRVRTSSANSRPGETRQTAVINIDQSNPKGDRNVTSNYESCCCPRIWKTLED